MTARALDLDPARSPDLLLRLLAEDPRFDQFARLFAPSPAAEYAGRVYFNRPLDPLDPLDLDAPSDPHGWKHSTRPVHLRSVLAAHVLAGAVNEAVSIRPDRPELLNAVALKAVPGSPVLCANIDLDGKHGCEPVSVIRALRNTLGDRAVMATDSGGTPGHYRALFRLDPAFAVEAYQELAGQLLSGIGFSPRRGAVEVFPSQRGTGSRLPFGRDGCVRYLGDSLEHGERLHPLALVAELSELDPVDLRAAVRRVTGAAVKVPLYRPPPVRVARAGQSVRVVDLWRNGVSGPGERDEAVFSLLRDCCRRGCSEARAVAEVQGWIDTGGLARSEIGHRPRRLQCERDHEVPRKARNVYLHPPHRPRAELSSLDVARVVEIAAPLLEPAPTVRLLLGVLPTFKGAAVAGLDGVTLHRDDWVQAGGSSGWDYARLRKECGLFEMVAPYRSRALFGDLARSITWRWVGFPFDPTQPRRPVVALRGRAPEAVYTAANLAACRACRDMLRESVAHGTVDREARDRAERDRADAQLRTGPGGATTELPALLARLRDRGLLNVRDK